MKYCGILIIGIVTWVFGFFSNYRNPGESEGFCGKDEGIRGTLRLTGFLG